MGIVKCTCGETISDAADYCYCCEKDFDGTEEHITEDFVNLEQYRFSPLAYDRNMKGLYEGSMCRSESIKGMSKIIDSIELKSEGFEIFDTDKYKKDFEERCIYNLGEETYKEFCDILTDSWKDGLSKRTKGPEILELKQAIHEYLCSLNGNNICCMASAPNLKTSLFTSHDIKTILNINESIFQIAIEDWVNNHSRGDEFGTNEVYFRRGINNRFTHGKEYKEKDYINSYSLSTTIAEQFSQTGSSTRSIISGTFGLFYDRILFFAPFIDGLEGQLEIGIIPHVSTLRLEYSETINSIDEFILRG